MCLKKLQTNTFEYSETLDFNDWILSIGNGTNGVTNDIDEDSDCKIVEIPSDLLITTTDNKMKVLVESTYPHLQIKFNDPEYIKDRAILATTNEIVDEINEYIMSFIPGSEKEYFSSDSISNCTDTCNDADILYPIEYLNSLNANNFPTHRLKLKIGVPIMLLRNLNQSLGLCNGTRLIVTNLGQNVIEAVIITGTHTDDKILIPRINLTT
jgi:ATP-dependent DNA helicase PIF1